ncbi:MAG: hypothetical protein ACRDRU_29145 [Pseudonocardiaceae bacterium]
MTVAEFEADEDDAEPDPDFASDPDFEPDPDFESAVDPDSEPDLDGVGSDLDLPSEPDSDLPFELDSAVLLARLSVR